MTPEQEASGFASKVHQSLVTADNDRLVWVPTRAALANGILWVVVAVTWELWVRAIIVGILVHCVIALLTRGDIHRFANLVGYLLFRSYYGGRR